MLRSFYEHKVWRPWHNNKVKLSLRAWALVMLNAVVRQWLGLKMSLILLWIWQLAETSLVGQTNDQGRRNQLDVRYYNRRMWLTLYFLPRWAVILLCGFSLLEYYILHDHKVVYHLALYVYSSYVQVHYFTSSYVFPLGTGSVYIDTQKACGVMVWGLLFFYYILYLLKLDYD